MARTRSALLALAWLATAVAAGFLFAWLLRRAPETLVVVREIPPPESRPAPPPPEAALPRVRSATGPEVPASATVPGAGASAFPVLEVTVVPAEGMPLGGGTVYALEAGASGPDDEEEVPHADVGEDLTATLRLPFPGTWDVGFSSTLGMGMVTDVRVEAGQSQKLIVRMAGTLRVSARCDPPWPPGDGDATIEVSLSDAESPGVHRWYPGRHEMGYSSASFSVGRDGKGESPALPGGRLFAVEATLLVNGDASATAVVECRPDRVKAGETLHLKVRERSALLVRIDRPKGLPADWQPVIVLRFRQGDRIVEDRRNLNAEFAGKTLEVLLAAEPGPGSLSWSGFGSTPLDREEPGLAPGASEDLVFEAGKVLEVAVPVAQAPSGTPFPAPTQAAAAEAPPAEPLGIEVRGVPEGKGRKVGIFGFVPGEGGGAGETWATILSEGETSIDSSWRSSRSIYVVEGARLASDPVPVPPTGPAVFVLKPAGLLVAVPDEVLPEGVGRLVLRLPDRRPIPLYSPDEESLNEARTDVSVTPGMNLGPLPEGTWTFEVRLAGVRLPDATATVKAGRIEVLRIRTRNP